MKPKIYVHVETRQDWERRFGHLPKSPLSNFEGSGCYDKATGDYLATQRLELCRPNIIKDVPDHIGPSGRVVHGNAGRREEIKRSEGQFIEWEPVRSRPRGVVADRKLAERYGVMCKGGLVHYDERAADYEAREHAKTAEGLADPLTGKVKAKRQRNLRTISRAERNDIAAVLAKHGVRD